MTSNGLSQSAAPRTVSFFFYDTGGDIVEDLGTLEYLKARIIRAHFGDEYE